MMCKDKMTGEMQQNANHIRTFNGQLTEIENLGSQEAQDKEQAKQLAKEKALQLAKEKILEKKKREQAEAEEKRVNEERAKRVEKELQDKAL